MDNELYDVGNKANKKSALCTLLNIKDFISKESYGINEYETGSFRDGYNTALFQVLVFIDEYEKGRLNK